MPTQLYQMRAVLAVLSLLPLFAACRGEKGPATDTSPAKDSARDISWSPRSERDEPAFTTSSAVLPPEMTMAMIDPWPAGATVMPHALPVPGRPVHLNVPLETQERTNWCWAASASMTRKFLGRPIDQCTQASALLGGTQGFPKDCCAPHRCDSPSFPDLGHLGELSFSHRDYKALSWDELTEQIRHGIPVPFTWMFRGGSEHMMVAVGFTTTPAGRWVYVNDPSPTDQQPAYIRYDEFVQSETHDHGRDYYLSKYLF